MLIAVIGGPIASGKSSLGRATAARLQDVRGAEVAVIDLDLIYEMLDPRARSGRPKSDERMWSQARRLAGRLAAALLAEGRQVVAEGNFAGDQSLAEFERELPGDARLRLIMLEVDFEVALERTQADASRGLSKDPVFLSTHHGRFSPQWREREVLQLDTGALSLAEATDAATAWLTAARVGPVPQRAWRGQLGSARLRADVTLHFPTRAERTGRQPHIASLQAQTWPEFMYHDAVLDRLFGRVVAEYPEFLFYAWDDEREEVVGVGHAIPAAWDGVSASLPDGGVDAVVEARFADAVPAPTALCALQILIAPEYRGQGLSRRMIERMAEIGRDHGLDTLVAPVRPTLKHRYPLTPIERYLSWRRPDGTHLDPWLRTHERLGAEIAKIAPESMRVSGTVAEWEKWTELALPESGTYVVPGALVPIEIDRDRDEGAYVEPNVWMVHSPPQANEP